MFGKDYFNGLVENEQSKQTNALYVDMSLADFDINFNDKNQMVLITKKNSIFGYSVSIHKNKKNHKKFAHFNLIKFDNENSKNRITEPDFNDFQKIMSVGSSVLVEKQDYIGAIIQELVNIRSQF